MAKKVICLLSIIILFCSTCFSSVYAKSNDENCSEDLLCAIDVAYQLREEYGFGDDDFSCLFASDEYYSYEATGSGFNLLTKARIIYNENKILFTLIQNADGDYQVDLFLTQMREYTNSRRMALIYCREGCYLFDGNQLIQLFNYNEKDCSRLSVSELRDFSGIEVSNTEPKYYLNYSGNNNTLRSVYYHSLAVGYITQNPYNSLCWLASTAMICNYVNSTSYTLATAYAQFQSVHTTWPSTITDSPLLTGSELAGIMNDSFSLSYTYRSETLSSMRVFNNIGNYKPVLGLTGKTSTSTNYVHAIVIYGADYNLGYFSIKDPQIGTVTVVNPPNYSYYNSYFGQNLYIRKIISRY